MAWTAEHTPVSRRLVEAGSTAMHVSAWQRRTHEDSDKMLWQGVCGS